MPSGFSAPLLPHLAKGLSWPALSLSLGSAAISIRPGCLPPPGLQGHQGATVYLPCLHPLMAVARTDPTLWLGWLAASQRDLSGHTGQKTRVKSGVR